MEKDKSKEIKSEIKLIKPCITTHKSLIGNMAFSLMKKIVIDISKKQKLNTKQEKELYSHIMTNSEQLFNYKIYKKNRKVLY
jgi:hypothetical protein